MGNSTTEAGNVTFTYTVTSSSPSSSSPSPLTALNNVVNFYVWVPTAVNITVADNLLSVVEEWREGGCSGRESFQNTRIEVKAYFTDGQEEFIGDILDLVVNKVSQILTLAVCPNYRWISLFSSKCVK